MSDLFFYNGDAVRAMRERLKGSTAIPLTRDGFLPAATRLVEGNDPTNYDAVWVRDSVWGYLALRSQAATRAEAKRLLVGLVSYFSTEKQRRRLQDAIRNPQDADVLHIRFDAKTLDDVQVGGQPQFWNHKQNDALGLFYQAFLDALGDGTLDATKLDDGAWEVLLRFPTYFDRLDFSNMADAGAWEEVDRINSSSIALVTSALERLVVLLRDEPWPERFLAAAKKLRLNPEAESVFNGRLEKLVEAGYARLRKQLPHESPDHPKDTVKYREADAALLSALYPARLTLSVEERAAIVDGLEPLIGLRGIRRYVGDSYQAGNYWLPGPPTGEADKRTDDCSAPDAFAERAKGMIPGSEAQWFFDSWYSLVCGQLYRETGDSRWHERQTKHFDRALAQLTEEGILGADGKPVPAFAFPESYNTIVEQERRFFAPSPITPLNWAKASMLLALEGLEKSADYLRFISTQNSPRKSPTLNPSAESLG